MGSYGSQSVEAISAMRAYAAQQKPEEPKYRMPDEQVVTIIMPVGLVRKIVKGYNTLLHHEKVEVRAAMKHALWDER